MFVSDTCYRAYWYIRFIKGSISSFWISLAVHHHPGGESYQGSYTNLHTIQCPRITPPRRNPHVDKPTKPTPFADRNGHLLPLGFLEICHPGRGRAPNWTKTKPRSFRRRRSPRVVWRAAERSHDCRSASCTRSRFTRAPPCSTPWSPLGPG